MWGIYSTHRTSSQDALFSYQVLLFVTPITLAVMSYKSEANRETDIHCIPPACCSEGIHALLSFSVLRLSLPCLARACRLVLAIRNFLCLLVSPFIPIIRVFVGLPKATDETASLRIRRHEQEQQF